VSSPLNSIDNCYCEQSLKFHWLTIPTNGTVCCALLYICWLGWGWVIVMFLACHDIHLFSTAIYIYVYIYSAQICIHIFVSFLDIIEGAVVLCPRLHMNFAKILNLVRSYGFKPWSWKCWTYIELHVDFIHGV